MLLFTLRESINSRGSILKNEINEIFSVPCTFGDTFDILRFSFRVCSCSSISNRIRYKVEDRAIKKKKKRNTILKVQMTVDQIKRLLFKKKTFKCWNLA